MKQNIYFSAQVDEGSHHRIQLEALSEQSRDCKRE